VVSRECPLHPKVKETLLSATSEDTTIIKRSIKKPCRVFDNATAQKVIDLENQGANITELLPLIGGDAYKRLIEFGDIDAGVISLGQGIGMIDELKDAKEIIDDTIREAEITLKRINHYFPQIVKHA
jgi:NAD(P)H-dependent flavin oxidoreductase YrpB (nitropropane dioxygenase family)